MLLANHPSPSTPYDVTLVGYGRYAGLHVGPKYAKPGYPWQPVAAVDPLLTRERFQSTVLGQSYPELPLHANFDEWYTGYFARLAPAQQRRQVVDIALRPERVYAEALRYMEAGVKQLILPKPVVVDDEQLAALTAAIARHEVKAAVASQWHYSDIPKVLQREIARLAGQPHLPLNRLKLHKVTMDFSKENGLAISPSPPLCELPHVVQLLASIGLLDLAHHQPVVNGHTTLVEVCYRPRNITQGIHLRADLDWRPAPAVKARYPHWDVQERSLQVYLSERPNTPSLAVDFWIKFDRTGDFALRPGKFTLYEHDAQGRPTTLTLEFVDDQLLTMLRKIYAAFAQDFVPFQSDPNNLSLARYGVIGRQLMAIEAAWQDIVHPTAETATQRPARPMTAGWCAAAPGSLLQSLWRELTRLPSRLESTV